MQIISFNTTEAAAKEAIPMLEEVVSRCETDQHIAENMIGGVDWSMKRFLQDGKRFSENGFITMAVDGELIGISACEVNSLIFANAVNFGIRLWVHPDHRSRRIPSLIISEQLKFAKELNKVAWASFNSDRSAMLRMIKIRAKDENPVISELWKDFKLVNHSVLVNNVWQKIAYKDFRQVHK